MKIAIPTSHVPDTKQNKDNDRFFLNIGLLLLTVITLIIVLANAYFSLTKGKSFINGQLISSLSNYAIYSLVYVVSGRKYRKK